MKVWSVLGFLLSLVIVTLVPLRMIGVVQGSFEDHAGFEVPFSAFSRMNDPHLMNVESPVGNNYFGACLMMKEDNDLLYEWIAYHFTMLPLRHLIIGSDENNTHNPMDVLSRWDGTGLNYSVLPPNHFVNRHGSYKRMKSKEQDDSYHHHQFIYRQRGFITTCAEKMVEAGVNWVAFIDSDEFLVFNTFNQDDNTLHENAEKTNTTQYLQRKRMTELLNSTASKLTALDIIQGVAEPLPCILMPRLRFSALETFSCPATSEVTQLAQQNFDYKAMSTLRYHQHAGKSNFQANRFGKVLVNLPQIENVSIWPKNIHRPFQKECPYPAIHFEDAFFSVNHYTASWERYSHRIDERRSCKRWLELAHVGEGEACYQGIHNWFPRFLKLVGEERAKYLLGVDVTLKTSQTAEQCPEKN